MTARSTAHQRMRSHLCACTALLALACGENRTAMIGDAYSRPARGATFLDLVQQVYDSMAPRVRLGVQRWTVRPGSNTMIEEAAAATAFANDANVIGVVGHAGSRDALIATAIYNEAGLAHIVPNATSRRLASAGPWTFPLAPSDSAEGAFITAWALDSLHAQRVAVLYVGDEYGVGLRDGVRSELRARGSDLADAAMVPNSGCATPGETALQRALAVAALRRGRPDVVVLAIGTSNSECLANIIATERPDVWMLAADGFGIELRRMAVMSPAVLSRVQVVRFWQPGTDSANRVFLARWNKALRRPPTDVDALIYDAYTLFGAAARDGATSRRAVRRWLESLGHSRPPYRGATGPISFDHGRVGMRLRMVPIAGALQ